MWGVQMEIREIKKFDRDLLLTLFLALDNETSFMLYEPGERKTTSEEWGRRIESISNSGGVIFGAEKDDRLVGFVLVQRGAVNRTKHRAYIVIGVLNSESGKGLGTELLKRVDEWAIKNEILKLELTVMVNNEKGLNLYKRMGFKVEGTRENSLIVDGNLCDEYFMGKIL